MNFDPKKLVLVSLAIVLSSCEQKSDPKPAKPQGKIVAWVGSEAITEKELLKELQQRGVNEPTEEAREEMLAQLVDFRRLFLAGKEKGWHADEEALLAAKRNVVLRVQHEFESQFDSIPKPTGEDIAAYYESHSDEFKTQEAALGAIIMRTENPEEAEAALNKMLEENTLPEDGTFGELAAEFSHDETTRVTQGRMRWITPSQKSTSRWPTPVFDELFKLESHGDTSPVTLLLDGAFVIRLLERHPSEPIPIERVSGDISARIIQERGAALQREFQQKLEATYPVRLEN